MKRSIDVKINEDDFYMGLNMLKNMLGRTFDDIAKDKDIDKVIKELQTSSLHLIVTCLLLGKKEGIEEKMKKELEKSKKEYYKNKEEIDKGVEEFFNCKVINGRIQIKSN